MLQLFPQFKNVTTPVCSAPVALPCVLHILWISGGFRSFRVLCPALHRLLLLRCPFLRPKRTTTATTTATQQLLRSVTTCKAGTRLRERDLLGQHHIIGCCCARVAAPRRRRRRCFGRRRRWRRGPLPEKKFIQVDLTGASVAAAAARTEQDIAATAAASAHTHTQIEE